MTDLRVQGLVFGRGGFRAGPIDLAARPGALVAVVGPNGSGKTTLLKTLAGLLPPLGGSIASGTRPPAYLPPPGAIEAGFAVGHVVALGRAAGRGWSPVLGRADREAATSVLARFDLAHLGERPFDTLSSGQQQLALMARLLVQDAPICLLDEPTAMLDPAQAARIDGAIAAMTGLGRVVVVSTHRLDFAARADIVVAVGDPVRVGDAGLLSPALVASLYGADLEPCESCGHWSGGSRRAPDSAKA